MTTTALGVEGAGVRDPLSLVFAALADPTRRAILARLKGGPVTVGELSRPFEMSGPAVSKHLRVLERAGLVSRSRVAQARPATLEAGPLEAVDDWLVPFLIDETDSEVLISIGMGALPEQAVHAADVVGRAAASAKHVVHSAFRKFPGVG